MLRSSVTSAMSHYHCRYIFLRAEIQMSGVAWQEQVKGLATFLTVQNSFVQGILVVYLMCYIWIYSPYSLSGKDCLLMVLQAYWVWFNMNISC